jgi:hypothetical protein
MVLQPGAQGASEIVGEVSADNGRSHIYEYLRRNSYIPWGHYAANMAHDAIRYRAESLSLPDMQSLRHLYYQRTYIRLAEECGIPVSQRRSGLSLEEIEALRCKIIKAGSAKPGLRGAPGMQSTLWGWNFGFDFAPSGYRLHASHQQIHQQYALIPEAFSEVSPSPDGDSGLRPFAFGDMIAEFIQEFRRYSGRNFFDCYQEAIRSNQRMDQNQNLPSSLIVYQDEHVMLFAPKAQTSQWELQLMTCERVGNVPEAGPEVRNSIDRAMLMAIQVFERMGARMVTHIEASKRFGAEDGDQRLMYFFLPKLPYSPGSFTECQLRWISNHYPEDFAEACRIHLRVC